MPFLVVYGIKPQSRRAHRGRARKDSIQFSARPVRQSVLCELCASVVIISKP